MMKMVSAFMRKSSANEAATSGQPTRPAPSHAIVVFHIITPLTCLCSVCSSSEPAHKCALYSDVTLACNEGWGRRNMRASGGTGDFKAKAIAGTHTVLIALDCPEARRKGLMGFAFQREIAGPDSRGP